MEKQQRIASFLGKLNANGELVELFNQLLQKLRSEPRSPSMGMFMPVSTGSILVRSTRVLEDVTTQNLSDSILMHLYGMDTIGGERWCHLIGRCGRPADMAIVFGAHLAERFNASMREEENEDAMDILQSMREGVDGEEEEKNREDLSEDRGEDGEEDDGEDNNDKDEDDDDGGDGGNDEEEEESRELGDEEDQKETEDDSDEDERNGMQENECRQGRKKRIRRQCTLCLRFQKYLSIHLQRVHNIPTQRRRLMLYEARKITPVTMNGLMGPTPCRRRLRDCPVQGCPAKGLKRVDAHLSGVHHMEKKSSEYQLQLMQASCKGYENEDVPPPGEHSSSKSTEEQATCTGQYQRYLAVRGGNTISAEKSAQQHPRQVESLLNRLHLTSMRQLVTPNIPMRIVESLRKGGMQPKTISSYLLSLKKLCKFFQTDRQMASCLGITNTNITSTLGCVDDFAASLRPATVRRELELRSHIEDILLPEDDIKKFKEAVVPELEAILRALHSCPDSVEWVRLVRLRNIIITLILLSSGHRSGVITQLRLGEFCDAREELIGALEPYFVIKVKRHKTSGTYGPVQIALTEELYQWCRAYMDLARPKTPGAPVNNDPTEPFFLGKGGAAVDRVAQEISRLGLAFGLCNLTPVNIRKTLASKVIRTQSAPSKAMICEHMAHQEATQVQYYKAANSTNDACQATVTITSLLDGSCANSAPHTASSPADDLPGPSGLQRYQTKGRSKSPPPLFSSDEENKEETDDDEGHDNDCIPPSSPLQSDKQNKRMRASFTLKEMRQIMALYEESRKKFSKKANMKNIVKAIYEEHSWLHKWSLQQLYDKIRHTLNDE